MRTDAKIGFAIVGVLVAVLMGFFVVNSRHTKVAKTNPPDGTVHLLKDAAPAAPDVVVPPVATGADPATPPTVATAKPTDAVPAVPSSPLVTGPFDHATGPAGGPPVTDTVVPEPLPASPRHSRTSAGTALARGNEGQGTAAHRTATHRRAPSQDDAPVATAGERSYTVRAGQTLTSIASDIYGDPHAWMQIQKANPKLNPSRLRVGTKILIPDPAAVRPHPAVVVPAADVIYADASADVLNTAAGTTYRVQSGDSLYKLARRFLGSGRRADALYELNRDVIGSSPRQLKRGMVLRIPTGTLSDTSR